MTAPRRVALVHDWLVSMRGGEKVFEVLCELFPDATVYTLLHVKGSVSPAIERLPIHTSFVQHLPGAATRYRNYLPLFPAAIGRFDLTGHDLIVSSSHCAAKAIHTPRGSAHICYCYTPMRYIWDQYDEYFSPGRASLPVRAAMGILRGPLQRWDLRTARNPHRFVAISENVRERIRRIYGRPSDLIYPPVDTARFTAPAGPGEFFLVVSALVPYKRVELAVEAFTRTGDPLVVVGSGPDEGRLRAMAGPNIRFDGWVADADLAEYYARCSALVFPGEEDFGIVPLEAMASGRPVVAYARGGALETVREGLTGTLFREQTVDSLLDAVARLRRTRFDPVAARAFAEGFDRALFKEQMAAYIARMYEEIQREKTSK
jgi:glycosyltransferase involved in cell wall biosynthesis